MTQQVDTQQSNINTQTTKQSFGDTSQHLDDDPGNNKSRHGHTDSGQPEDRSRLIESTKATNLVESINN